MSVTFWCPDAPRKEVPCPYCTDEFKCEPWCRGTENVSESPDPNFSNVNARGVLQLLGLDAEYLCGSCDGATLRQKILKARNSDRSDLVRDSFEVQGGHAGTSVIKDRDGVPRIQRMGAHAIFGGNTDEQTLRRLSNLEELAVYAQDHDYKVTWG